MRRQKAPQTVATPSTAAISALVLLGAWCGSALAANEFKAPCPETAQYAETALHAILDNNDVTSPSLRTVDSANAVSPAPVADAAAKPNHEEGSDADAVVIQRSAAPEISTRLPGVSSSDEPRFRRHMYRTDI